MSLARTTRPASWVCQSCKIKGSGALAARARRWQHTASSAATPPTSARSAPRQWSTPLAKTIGEAIQTTGPISIAQYMRQCLTSPDGGYYTQPTTDRDPFGQKGDFITSPEISQVFGELLGLWFITEWMAQGRPKTGVELVEVGPGRGTLMDDILRTARNFKAFSGAIESVYLVEASASLRAKQKELLCGKDAVMEETDIGWKSKSRWGDVPVTWCEDIRFVPNAPEKTPFIVAHEFFDALPIHAFKAVPPAEEKPSTVLGLDGKPLQVKSTPTRKTAKSHQWRELLVALARPTGQFDAKNPNEPVNVSKDVKADFELTQAKASNPSSLVIPEISERYQKLKSTTDAIIEISPESHAYAGEFARRIGGSNLNASAGTTPSSIMPKAQPSGAALILDYGTMDTIPTSTLRGIRQHQLVSPFSLPGETDLSADVDFTALADAAINASPGVEVHGPVEQGVFLESCGIRERAKILEKRARKQGDEKGEEAAKRITDAIERLVERGGGGMGKIYKAMAIIPENGGRRRPVGFGGQVVQ